jgi:hypothetical protein
MNEAPADRAQRHTTTAMTAVFLQNGMIVFVIEE